MSLQHLITVLILSNFLSALVSADVTYEDLEEIEGTCHTLDTCSIRRSFDSLEKYTCNCGSFCSKLGTCCVDSRYRDRRPPKRKPICRPVNGKNGYSYFMVDNCSTRRSTDDTFKNLCRDEWNEDDNIMSLVPVTSLSSNVTYKNYFCFRCNEETKKFLYWNVRLNSDGGASIDDPEKDVTLSYSKESNIWTADVGRTGNSIPVTLRLEIPAEIQKLPKVCVLDAISSCDAKWKIKKVKRMCAEYTSYISLVKNGDTVMYRNPHCALCNFAGLEKMGCGIFSDQRRFTQKKLFSFTFLMDINRSGGDKVGKIQRCPDNETFDPFFDECRALKCAMPGYKLKDRKCVPP